MLIELPKIGQIWQRGKLQREILKIIKESNKNNDYYIIWARPGEQKTHTIWLKYWKQWRNKAALVRVI